MKNGLYPKPTAKKQVMQPCRQLISPQVSSDQSLHSPKTRVVYLLLPFQENPPNFKQFSDDMLYVLSYTAGVLSMGITQFQPAQSGFCPSTLAPCSIKTEHDHLTCLFTGLDLNLQGAIVHLGAFSFPGYLVFPRGFHEVLQGLRDGVSTKKSTACCWGYHLSLFLFLFRCVCGPQKTMHPCTALAVRQGFDPNGRRALEVRPGALRAELQRLPRHRGAGRAHGHGAVLGRWISPKLGSWLKFGSHIWVSLLRAFGFWL